MLSPQMRRLSLGFTLFTLLCGVYLLFYRGRPLSIDEISMFDSIESLVHHGTLSRTIEFYRTPVIVTDSPYLKPLYEPLQIIAASPFYWLANKLPGIGQFQTVFILNILVTALTAVSLYFIALRQNYSLTTAWVGALIFGIATQALPYSRWLFREPLMSFFTLWAFFFALTIPHRLQQKQPVYLHLGLLILSILGIILTKTVGILMIPGIVLCLLPDFRRIRQVAPVLLLLGGVILAFLIVVSIINPDFGDDRYSLSRWLNVANFGWQHIWESLLGYQISPGRSFWLYSPVLLLGFIGSVVLIRGGKAPFVVAMILTLLGTSAAYGALRLGSYWNGGWSWGPRYLLPLIPLWMLLVLPVIEKAWQKPLARTGVMLLTFISFLIQLVGMAIPYTDFYNLIDQQRETLNIADYVAWSPDNWVWAESSIPYHLNNLDQLDSAWRFAEPSFLAPLFFMGMIIGAVVLGIYVIRNNQLSRRWLYLSGIAALALPFTGTAIGLKSLQNDARYIGDRRDVFELIQQLNHSVEKDDVLLLNGNEYMVMFMNWFKPGTLFIALPYPLREMYVEGEAPFAPETRQALLTPETVSVVGWAAKATDRVWVIVQSDPFTLNAIRPLEHYMVTNFFPIEEITFAQHARAIAFAPRMGELIDIQPPGGLIADVQLSDTTFTPGETMLLSLTWQPDKALETDYLVSVQLIDENGALALQRDSLPQGTFGLTSTWQVGEQYQDHHALALPLTIQPGTYTLQIVVYQLQDTAVYATIPLTQIQIEN